MIPLRIYERTDRAHIAKVIATRRALCIGEDVRHPIILESTKERR